VAMANMLERPAARRLFAAMRAEPLMVAGTGRLNAVLMGARPDVVAKTGAEGTYVAVVPDKGLGLALKAEDGAGRAAEVALLAVLGRLVGGIEKHPELRPFAEPPVTNVAGKTVGTIRPAEGWPAF